MSDKQGYYSLILVIYFFTFQFALMQISPIFDYWDELYAVCAIPLFFMDIRSYRTGNRLYRRLILLLTLYILIGLFCNVLYGFQVINGILRDLLLQLKFYLGIATTFYLFRNTSLDTYGVFVKKHVRIIMMVLFVLTITNYVLHFFPINEKRFGISSQQLFFGHPTGLASVSFFLILMLTMFYTKNIYDEYYIAVGTVLVLATLRFKAIAAVLLFCYVFIVVEVLGKRISGWKILPIIPFATLIGWDQFYSYFFSERTMQSARGAEFHTGFKILRDFFPIGTGLGTFASDPSAKYYSPIYILYDINKVWGLEENNPFLVSDTFWPMIMGQTGAIGLILYLMIVICLIKMIKPAYNMDKGFYLAGLGAIIYLLVSSTSEAAFVNPLSLPLALVIGLVLCQIYQEGKP